MSERLVSTQLTINYLDTAKNKVSAMKFNYETRLEKLRGQMQEQNVDLLVFGGADRLDPNAYYYSSDTAFPTIIIASQDDATIFSTLQGDELAPVFNNVKPFKNWKKEVKQIIEKSKAKKVGFDSRSDTLGFFAFEKTNCEKVDFTTQFLEIREKKDSQEVKLIKKAQEITKKAVGQTLEENLVGLTENQIAGKIEAKVRELNASLDAFTPLVQNGERSAAWHNATTNNKVNLSKPLLIDVGAKYEFYCADHTVTYYEGNDKFTKDAINAVRESQRKAQAVAEKEKNGKKAGEIALQVLREYGYVDHTYFDVGLSLGHGVGLEVHDGHRRINEVEQLESGMCFTVEPGLYFPKKFGVRFEDVAFIS